MVISHPLGLHWHERFRAANPQLVPHALPDVSFCSPGSSGGLPLLAAAAAAAAVAAAAAPACCPTACSAACLPTNPSWPLQPAHRSTTLRCAGLFLQRAALEQLIADLPLRLATVPVTLCCLLPCLLQRAVLEQLTAELRPLMLCCLLPRLLQKAALEQLIADLPLRLESFTDEDDFYLSLLQVGLRYECVRVSGHTPNQSWVCVLPGHGRILLTTVGAQPHLQSFPSPATAGARRICPPRGAHPPSWQRDHRLWQGQQAAGGAYGQPAARPPGCAAGWAAYRGVLWVRGLWTAGMCAYRSLLPVGVYFG